MSAEQDAARDPESRAEIDVSDAAAVARWTRALGLTDEALCAAVRAVGPRVDRVKEYLGQGGMAPHQSDG